MADETRPDKGNEDNRLTRFAINDCELSVRTTNALQRYGRYKTLADLDAATDDELHRIPHLSTKGISEVRGAIRAVRFGALSLDDEVIAWAQAHLTLVRALMNGEAVIVPRSGEVAA